MISKLKYTALSLLIIFAYSAAHAVINGANVTLTASTLCNNGSIEKRFTGGCPSGYSAGSLPTLAIQGWGAVTQPLDATGSGVRIDVGGGNNDHADLSTLDTAVLTPGSVVNIFYRAQAYTQKLAFFTDGTEANPIRIHGVTDSNGNQPVIECSGATTVTPARWSALYSAPYGCWQLSYTRETAYAEGTNDGPSWYKFSHITIQGANPDNTFDGGTAYVDGASSIRISNGEHFFFEGMRFIDNSNGLFAASNYVIKHVEIRGSYFSGNGLSGSYLEHNLYLQAVSDSASQPNIVEGNYFGPLRAGALGLSGGKLRGTDNIYRYNTAICWQRCLDIVEAQDALPAWIYDNFTAQEIVDRYRTAYVYGNQFHIDDNYNWTTAFGIHCGMDTGQTGNGQVFHDPNAGAGAGLPQARCIDGGALYFYHNSIHARVNAIYTSSFFDMDAGSSGDGLYDGLIYAANNVWEFELSGGANFVAHARESGTVNYQGVNHVTVVGSSGTQVYEGENVNDDPDITINGASAPTLVVTMDATNDPLFTTDTGSDPEAIDLSPQSGSPIIGAAGSLSTAMQAYPVLMQPNPASSGGGALTRGATSNIGAYE